MTAKVSFVEPIAMTSEEITACSIAGGAPIFIPPASMFCFTQVPYADLFGWNETEFSVYRHQNFGTAPGFFVEPALRGPGEYPNTVSSTSGKTVMAAAVDCDGLPPAAALRWVWEKQFDGICFFSEVHQRNLCSKQGVNRNNANYFDKDGNQLLSYHINYDVYCPS
jgi:hypothetical protein